MSQAPRQMPEPPDDKSGREVKKRRKLVLKTPGDAEGIVKLEKSLISVAGQRPTLTISGQDKLWYRGPMTIDCWRLLRHTPKVYCFYKLVNGDLQLLSEAPVQKW